MKRLGAVGLVAAVIAGIATAAFVLRADDETTEAIGTAADALVAGGVPAVLVRVRDGNEQPVELQRGDASAGDRFRVGSVTKTFVAAAALMLADEGRLSLDDPVDRHVFGLLRDGDRVVVRDLLDHTAGLFDYTSVRELRDGERSPRDLVDLTNTQDRNPGAVFEHQLPRPRARPRGGLRQVARRAPGRRIRPLRPRGHDVRARTRPRPVPPRSRAGVPRRHRNGAAARHRGAYRPVRLGGRCGRLDRGRPRAFLHPPAGERPRSADDAAPARRASASASCASQTACGPAVGHTGNVLGTVTVVWARGDRVLVAAANVFPLTPDQEAAFQRLLGRAFCG